MNVPKLDNDLEEEVKGVGVVVVLNPTCGASQPRRT